MSVTGFYRGVAEVQRGCFNGGASILYSYCGQRSDW